ncbi:hypothetical protein [Aestuariicoccus sp. MJ-SS9]|nr:hypothetical protein [Aestuariicoccus sp. MJ-SS9]MDU8914006.1 hypothetical protein [Aestuariicoccus sp. MJ-SS9]
MSHFFSGPLAQEFGADAGLAKPDSSLELICDEEAQDTAAE